MVGRQLVAYRVQDAMGRSPWKPGFSHLWVRDRPDHDNLAPILTKRNAPAINMMIIRSRYPIGASIGHGCLTPEQLRRWINEAEYRDLIDMGYQAVTVPISEILVDDGNQILFISRCALRFRAQAFDLYEKTRQEA